VDFQFIEGRAGKRDGERERGREGERVGERVESERENCTQRNEVFSGSTIQWRLKGAWICKVGERRDRSSDRHLLPLSLTNTP